MLTLQNVSYLHPDKSLLLDNISISVTDHSKIALIGNNGAGKSTLLRIIAGNLPPGSGQLKTDMTSCFVPQLFGQYNNTTIAGALRVEEKINALKEIMNGRVTEQNLTILNDDWTIEERCMAALNKWQLGSLDLNLPMSCLSGGQKTKVFLAGIAIHRPRLVLLDEPSNHLDAAGKNRLYDFIRSAACALIVVSHDRKLLNLLNTIYELSNHKISVYSGNYDFYTAQKLAEKSALTQSIHSKEKELRKAREKERETIERQQKLDARGKKKQEKAGVARIMMNTLRNNAENSTSKIKSAHAEKISGFSQELRELRTALPGIDTMKMGWNHAALHKGKILFAGTAVNFSYGHEQLWKNPLTLRISSGERIVLKGLNGSGKTTLIKIIRGKTVPSAGTVYRAENQSIYIDQDYSLINNNLTIYEQAQQFNTTALQEHKIKIRLDRFLFPEETWAQRCATLSGGERMRLLLCCLTISSQSPDMIILDEPTNNLDIQNIEMLTTAVNQYKGTLIVVSHDEIFLDQLHIERAIDLS